MTKKPIIEFKDFTFQYYSQSKPTLHDINLTIYPGEKILIVGPSGSGKSTLGHCLNGLIPFSYPGTSQGCLKLSGIETKEADIFTLSKHIGTVLQDADGQFVGLTVGEDIAFAMENDCLPQDLMRQRVKKVSDMVDMDSFLNHSPFELSGGQKQRTSLAGVMIDDVEVLLFDEPLANLDPKTGKVAIEIIDDIQKMTQSTVIIIEHRLEDVLHRQVDRIIIIDEGRIIADDTADKIVSSSLLIDTGIREPLYVSGLKLAGVKVSPDMRPGYIETLDLKEEASQLKDWFMDQKKPEEESEAQSLLRLENLHFSYDGVKPVLKDISFDIKKGEMVSIVGTNGAGKSTVSKLLCGFEKPDQGAIYFKGEDIKDKTIRERARLIGLVMQNPNQMISKPMIYDEVALGLRLRGRSEEEVKEKVSQVLKVCGLAPFINWPISALSYGQKKRVTIACILALDPPVLILDEPTAGQDYYHYSEIMEFIRDINQKGVTVIMITHDMHLMLEYTPRAIVLSGGRLVSDDDSSAILTDPAIIEEANLKETSLFYLAQAADISDETAFVQAFIDGDRVRRKTLREKIRASQAAEEGDGGPQKS